jgi:tRNA(fMet)-specific endonuclease VapC
MEKICLDTGIITEYLMNKPETVQKIMQVEKTANLAVTPQIIFELFCFAEASDKPGENKQVIRDFIKRLTVINWTPETAELAAEILTKAEKAGLREVFLTALVNSNNYMLLTDHPEAYDGLGTKIYI